MMTTLDARATNLPRARRSRTSGAATPSGSARAGRVTWTALLLGRRPAR
jgi:hypothetical protein